MEPGVQVCPAPRPSVHERRAVAASRAFYRGVALADLTKAVGWSQQTTFGRFYLRLPDQDLLGDDGTMGDVLLPGPPRAAST